MYASISEIKARNAAAGFHFFEPATMRFFDSRIRRKVIGGRYFITSERFHGFNGHVAQRKYTIWQAEDSGDINTVGEFQYYSTPGSAERAARALSLD